jgi:hypothetical protein
VSEWSPAVSELNNAVDRLGELTNVIITVFGGKPTRIRPRPRPITAIDRLRDQQRVDQHRSLVTRLIPVDPT